MKNKHERLVLIFSFLIHSLVYADVSVDFNQASDLATYFNGTSGSTFTYGSTAGLSGGGGVNAPDGVHQAFTYKNGFALTAGTTYTASMYFQYADNWGYNALGFATTDNGNMAYSQTGLRENSLGAIFDLTDINVLTYHTGTSQETYDAGSHPNSAAGNWYYVTLALTYDGGDAFSGSATFWNSDSSGVVGSLGGSNAFSVVDSTLSGATHLYAYFGATYANNCYNNMDNFSVGVVPEPSAVTLMAAIAAGALFIRRIFLV